MVNNDNRSDNTKILPHQHGENNYQIILSLCNQFSQDAFTIQSTRTGMLVIWIKREQLLAIIEFFKKQIKPYVMLFDLYGVDERQIVYQQTLPKTDLSVFTILFLLSVTVM